MGGNYSLLVVEADGNLITAANRNAEHQNHINYATPAGLDDYSSSVAQMKQNTDPGEAETESLAKSIGGELERLRFAVKEVKGTTEWYPTPANSMAAIDSSITSINGTLSTKLSNTGLLIPGTIYNLGMTYAAGVFKITAADGTDLSASNYGCICVPGTTAGITKLLKVTVSQSFNDDAHASSDMASVLWRDSARASNSNAFPFYIFAVNRNNSDIDGADGNSCFAISISPVHILSKTSSIVNYIGDNDAVPTNPSYRNIMLMGSYTQANYLSLPLTIVGCFRMLWTQSTADWTVQTLSSDYGDGMGLANLQKMSRVSFSYAGGETDANKYCEGATTGAVYATNDYYFQVDPFSGLVTMLINLRNDGGTDGNGGASLNLGCPYTVGDMYQYCSVGYLYVRTAASVYEICYPRSGGGGRGAIQLYKQAAGGAGDVALLDSDQAYTSRFIRGAITMRCFDRIA